MNQYVGRTFSNGKEDAKTCPLQRMDRLHVQLAVRRDRAHGAWRIRSLLSSAFAFVGRVTTARSGR